MLSTLVRQLRSRRHFTQQLLAVLCGMGQGNISRIENLKLCATRTQADRISKVLGVDSAELFDELGCARLQTMDRGHIDRSPVL